MISKKNKSGTLSIPLTTTQTHPDNTFLHWAFHGSYFDRHFTFLSPKQKDLRKLFFFWWRIHRMTSLLLIFIWNLLLPLKACFFFIMFHITALLPGMKLYTHTEWSWVVMQYTGGSGSDVRCSSWRCGGGSCTSPASVSSSSGPAESSVQTSPRSPRSASLVSAV